MRRKNLFLIGLLFGGAFALRLLYALYLFPIDWNWDSYHHWQIAYYTLHIGLKYGRMWDLMGCEYYWPPLPLLTESLLLGLFGTSVWYMRILNMIIGSGSAALAFLIGKEKDKNTGLLSAMLVATFPVLAFHDILALSETMMVFFSLLGVLMLLKGRDFYTGLAFGVASLCHFAAYPLIIILIAYEIMSKRGDIGLIPAVAGFGVMFIPYLYMLYAHTGDWFYMFRIIGFPKYEWNVRMMYITLGLCMIVPAVIGLTYYHRKNKIEPLTFFSLGELLVFGGLLTIRTPPLFGAERYYMLLSAFVALLLGYYLARLKLRFKRIHLSSLMFLEVMLCVLLTLSLAPRFTPYQGHVRTFFEVADWLGQKYQGGTIICELPPITYRLIDYWRIHGGNILGAHYCPPDPEPKAEWLMKHNVTWIIYSTADFDFTNRIFPELGDARDHPPFFLAISFGEIIIYKLRL